MTLTRQYIAKVIGFVLVLVALFAFFQYRNTNLTALRPGAESITGCYVHKIANDVYTLAIKSQSAQKFNGTLEFKNFEKDSSSGSYAGTYVDEILSGEYSFQSEGTDSVMNVQFKKDGNNFIRGIEQEEGGVLFDAEIPGSLFKKSQCL